MRITSFMLRKKLQRRAAAFVGLAGVFLLALGTPAWAVTYYLAPGGNDAGAGTSLGTAWLTLSKANSTLQAGDVVLIQPGTYSGGIAPARDGGASSRISYVGSLTSPGAAVVGSISLTGRKYISVKGVTSTGDIEINATSSSVPAEYDSVNYVTGRGSLRMTGAHFSYVGNSTIGDDSDEDVLQMGYQFSDTTRFCTLASNTFNLVTPMYHYATYINSIRNCTFTRNLFNIRVPSTTIDGGPSPRYRMYNNTFSDNKQIVLNQLPSSVTVSGLLMRDRCRYNSWTRDTFLVHPASTGMVRYKFASAGNEAGSGSGADMHYPDDGLHYNDWLVLDDADGSCGYNTWTDCYFQSSGSDGDGLGMTQKTHHDVFTGNTFFSKQAFLAFADSLTFRHNTVVNVSPGSVIDGWDESDGLTSPRITNNIFYGTSTSGTYNPINIPRAIMGTWGVVDTNLVFNWRVGAALVPTVAPTRSFNPLLQDSLWASGRSLPRNQLAFSHTYWPDGYVGAIASGTVVGDLVPPGAVSDLALALISDHTIVLRWTATGDDGTAGQASVYDLRWSNQPITPRRRRSGSSRCPLSRALRRVTC
jgi:hypothetical protein